jgi:hypothetical protein
MKSQAHASFLFPLIIVQNKSVVLNFYFFIYLLCMEYLFILVLDTDSPLKVHSFELFTKLTIRYYSIVSIS